MKTLFPLCVILLLIPTTILSGQERVQAFQKARQPRSFVEGEVLVKYRATATTSEKRASMSRVGVMAAKSIGSAGFQKAILPPGLSVEGAIELLNQDPQVEYVQPNRIFRIAATGVQVDDFWVTCSSTDYSGALSLYEEQSGSSMAAAHVSGLAALVQAANPGYSALQIKNAITNISNVDLKPALTGMVATGGIINAYKALGGTDPSPATVATYDSKGSLWGMEKISMPAAWNLLTGSSSVVVAVIDTGVDYNHPDLSANIGVSDGWDFVDNDADPMDSKGHGTHVAGTIGAVGNNGTGVAGVNWSVKILPLRALDSVGEGTEADLVEAIAYAQQKGAWIINASWGIDEPGTPPGSPSALRAAVAAFIQAGGLFVTTAGNTGVNIDSIYHYPASWSTSSGFETMIVATATNEADTLEFTTTPPSSASYGPTCVHVGAPGIIINSSIPPRTVISGSNKFNTGTLDQGWTTGGTGNNWSVTYLGPGDWMLATSAYPLNADSWASTPQMPLGTGCSVGFYLGLRPRDGGPACHGDFDGRRFMATGGRVHRCRRKHGRLPLPQRRRPEAL